MRPVLSVSIGVNYHCSKRVICVELANNHAMKWQMSIHWTCGVDAVAAESMNDAVTPHRHRMLTSIVYEHREHPKKLHQFKLVKNKSNNQKFHQIFRNILRMIWCLHCLPNRWFVFQHCANGLPSNWTIRPEGIARNMFQFDVALIVHCDGTVETTTMLFLDLTRTMEINTKCM